MDRQQRKGAHRKRKQDTLLARAAVRAAAGKSGNGGKRTLVTGVRRGGASDYELKVHAAHGSTVPSFPPLLIKMSLHDMQQWLHEMQSAPADCDRRRLRIV